eukprot:Polyplicarium_translucidae@DN2492_c0_g1_i2.p2
MEQTGTSEELGEDEAGAEDHGCLRESQLPGRVRAGGVAASAAEEPVIQPPPPKDTHAVLPRCLHAGEVRVRPIPYPSEICTSRVRSQEEDKNGTLRRAVALGADDVRRGLAWKMLRGKPEVVTGQGITEVNDDGTPAAHAARLRVAIELNDDVPRFRVPIDDWLAEGEKRRGSTQGVPLVLDEMGQRAAYPCGVWV